MKKNSVIHFMQKHRIISLFIGIVSIIIFVFLYQICTVPGDIIENEPYKQLLCSINPLTEMGRASYVCNNENDYTFKKLKDWSGYYGCNESTINYNNGYVENLTKCETKHII